jgi:hypothetical protein
MRASRFESPRSQRWRSVSKYCEQASGLDAGRRRKPLIVCARRLVKFYSQDLINNLFTHPYTKIAFIERDLKVSRLTATKYLDALAERGFLQKQKIGRSNYYVNVVLNRILIGAEMGSGNV